MVKKHAEMKREIRSQVRGGVGDLEMVHLLEEAELSGKAKMCAKFTIAPGCSIGEHAHDPDGELYIILSGAGMVNDNGTPREVSAGDAVWTADGERHSIINHGTKPLELSAIVIN